jgi:hypothetical protein
MHLHLPQRQQASRQIPKQDAEGKVLLARRSAVVGQRLSGSRVRQRALALDVFSWTSDGLEGAVGAAGGGEGVSACLGARGNGDGVQGVLELVGRMLADLATAGRIVVVESFIGS